MLWISVAVWLSCIAVVLVHSAGRDLSQEAIGAGGWIGLTVAFGPAALLMYLVLSRDMPRV